MNHETLKLLLLLENQTYSWRWRLAQFLELRWWRRYLQQLNWPDYVEAKRVHWRKVLTQMELQLLSGERVLDAGCGPAGIFTILEAQKVDAIDPLLEAYEKKLPDFQLNQFPYVHFQAMMLEQLDQQEVYDHVFCLNAINHVAAQGYAPWHLGFSYGRALQHSCLQQWGGSELQAGQAALLARASANAAASRGAYEPGSELSDDTSLFVANYSY